MDVHRMIRCRPARLLAIATASLWIVVGACDRNSTGTGPVLPAGPDTPRVVTSVVVSPSQRTLGILGITVQLAAGAWAQDGSHVYGLRTHPERFSWSSSAPDIVTVDRGRITSVGEGTATVTATVEGVTGTVTVTVRDAARFAWSVPTHTGEMRAGIAIGDDGTIYVAARARLLAFSPQGTLLWTFETPSGVLAAPAIGDDGTLYLGSTSGGGLTAVGPGGAVLWVLPDVGSIISSPVLGLDGTIYVAGDHHVYAVNRHGEIQWTYGSTGRFGYSSPAIASDGTIYAGGGDGVLHAINADGSRRWTFQAEDQIQSSPSIGTDGTIYFGSYDRRLYAVNPNGAERWRSESLGRIITSSPSVAPDGTIYVGAAGVFAIDPGGSILWNHPPSGVATSTILGADGTVYVGVAGAIQALDAQGRLLWDYPTGTILGSPAIGLEGTILTTSSDGTVYAIVETESANGGYAGAPWPKEQRDRANTGRAGG